ncbi:MAG: hypothetical protein IJ852_01725 [Alphaproteobacteria bacterium]|nr:hypothetical protein [Alphaproteobacteria bacterium]
MSKSVGKIFGTGSTDAYGYEKNYVNYLKNYDTSVYDNTLNNLTSRAYAMSTNLDALPDFRLTVDGSDEARQRAENATYQSYMDKLQPEFQRQRTDMETALINKGLSVGSEAYQRAMSDLVDEQNQALNQAAYQSVLNGQNAYSNSLTDDIHAAQFSNAAQRYYIDLLHSLLNGSVSGYDNQSNLYAAQGGVQNRINQARQGAFNNLINVASGAAGVVAPQTRIASTLTNNRR